MIQGRVGVWDPSKMDDVIYEQPLRRIFVIAKLEFIFLILNTVSITDKHHNTVA